MTNFFIQHASLPNLADGTYQTVDVQVTEGYITAIKPHLSPLPNSIMIPAKGMYLTAGWIDAHTHIYTTTDSIGVNRNSFLSDGVTYAIDAGTTGPENFEDYLSQSHHGQHIPSKAYLNLAPMGVIKPYGELTNLNLVNLDACEHMIARYPKEILGVKLRIDPRVCENPWKAMRLIRELSDRTKKPLVVHASRSQMPLEEILAFMQQGDIFAHSFADKAPGLLDSDGNVKKAALQARERGVCFDLSHGKSNFSFPVARKAFSQGFLPDAISTDLHSGSLDIVKSLAYTMSKLLACNLDLITVLRLVTVDAARMLQLSDKATSVISGAPADLTLFEIAEGTFTYQDSDGNTVTGTKQIKPHYTILGQTLYHSNTKAFSL